MSWNRSRTKIRRTLPTSFYPFHLLQASPQVPALHTGLGSMLTEVQQKVATQKNECFVCICQNQSVSPKLQKHDLLPPAARCLFTRPSTCTCHRRCHTTPLAPPASKAQGSGLPMGGRGVSGQDKWGQASAASSVWNVWNVGQECVGRLYTAIVNFSDDKSWKGVAFVMESLPLQLGNSGKLWLKFKLQEDLPSPSRIESTENSRICSEIRYLTWDTNDGEQATKSEWENQSRHA